MSSHHGGIHVAGVVGDVEDDTAPWNRNSGGIWILVVYRSIYDVAGEGCFAPSMEWLRTRCLGVIARHQDLRYSLRKRWVSWCNVAIVFVFEVVGVGEQGLVETTYL